MIYCLAFRCRHEAIVIRVCKWRTTFICAAAHEYTPHILHHFQLERNGRIPHGLVEQIHAFATCTSRFDYLITEMLIIGKLDLELNVYPEN